MQTWPVAHTLKQGLSAVNIIAISLDTFRQEHVIFCKEGRPAFEGVGTVPDAKHPCIRDQTWSNNPRPEGEPAELYNLTDEATQLSAQFGNY